MAAVRASYSIKPEVLLEFNALVPSGERSQLVESLMKTALIERERAIEAIAEEYNTHPDFAEVRADSTLWEAATLSDGFED